MTLRCRVLAFALFATACGEDQHCSDDESCAGEGDEGTPDGAHPRWLVDAWYHDDGRENYADYADYYITLGDDGNGEYYDDHGVFAFSGPWSLVGKTLTVGDYTLQIDWTDNCAVISAEGKTFIGTIEAERPDCPTMTPPLTALEKCLVGDWSSSSNDGSISNQSWLTLGADRSYLETWDDSGYTSGGSAGAVEGRWELVEGGDIMVTYPGGSQEVRSSILGVTGMGRDTPIAAGCDQDALEQAIAGGCAQGDPYQCDGAQLLDCASGDRYDCQAECVAAGYSGTSDPPCAAGSDGYPQCLCV